MLLKKAVREDCDKCGRFVREVSPEQHGCDQCKKPIVPFGNDERLDIRMFKQAGGTETFYFCSWRCVFTFARKIHTDYFFTLPYVSMDNVMPGRRVKDFQAEIKKIFRK